MPCLFVPFHVAQALQNTFTNCSAPLFGRNGFFSICAVLEPEQCEQEAYPQQKMFRNRMYLRSENMV